jgi:branched-chain amino acid transport system substrate-binding protein
MTTLYVGNAQAKGSEPEDLFNVTQLVKGTDAAASPEEAGCKMTWPSAT